MSQLDTLAALDAELHAAFADAGLADAATYTPPPPSPLPDGYEPPAPIPVRVYVNRDVTAVGDATAVRTELGVLLADTTPRRGGVVVVTDDGGSYRLERELRNDGSLSWWVSNRVTAS